MNAKMVNILLVEDDEVDVEAVLRAFRKHRIANPVQVAQNGIEALDCLRRGDIVKPYLILLDLNMPKMSGLEFLAELRNDVQLKDAIVFVLTTSDADKDKCAAYQNNVAGYLVKSKIGEDFMHLIDILGCYWRYVEFPLDPVALETEKDPQ